MKLLQLIMLCSISGAVFNAYSMDDGQMVTKEKRQETIKGKKYSFKVFRQSRTEYEPLELFVSRATNKTTGKKSFSGGVSNLYLDPETQEYTPYLGGTTNLDDGEFTQMKWQELKKSFKVQKLNSLS